MRNVLATIKKNRAYAHKYRHSWLISPSVLLCIGDEYGSVNSNMVWAGDHHYDLDCTGDGWFRKPKNPRNLNMGIDGYGLCIRNLKIRNISKFYPDKDIAGVPMSHFDSFIQDPDGDLTDVLMRDAPYHRMYAGEVTYLPSGEDWDDPAAYETTKCILLIPLNLALEDVLAYVRSNKGDWVP